MTLEALSLRVLRLTVAWRMPEWKPKQATWLSGTAHSQFWIDEERERFTQLAGQIGDLELMQAFPERSWYSLRKQAMSRGLPLLSLMGPFSQNHADWHEKLLPHTSN